MGSEGAGAVTPERISARIVLVRGEKVLLDSDLAALYAVTTKRLNEQVRRNRERFPSDFVFALTDQEVAVLRSQNATSNEHGALMAANILSSRRAIEVSVFVVRAFIRLRETLAAHKELSRKLEELEKKVAALSSKHDALAADTRFQFTEVIEALRRLMSPPAPSRRPIGFVTPR